MNLDRDPSALADIDAFLESNAQIFESFWKKLPQEGVVIHGSRAKWKDSIGTHGVRHKESGFFCISRPDITPSTLFEEHKKLTLTLAIVVYHSISLAVIRTLRDADCSIVEWFRTNEHQLPIFFVAKGAERSHHESAVYASSMEAFATNSYPYRSVESSGGIVPDRLSHILPLSIEDLEECSKGNDCLVRREDMGLQHGAARFFSKICNDTDQQISANSCARREIEIANLCFMIGGKILLQRLESSIAIEGASPLLIARSTSHSINQLIDHEAR